MEQSATLVSSEARTNHVLVETPLPVIKNVLILQNNFIRSRNLTFHMI